MPSQRALEAIKLRAEGLTYQEIGDRLGITRQGAHLLVNPDRRREYIREVEQKRKGVMHITQRGMDKLNS